MHVRVSFLALPVFLAAATSASAQSDCGAWQGTFAPPGVDDPVLTWAAYDDGTGPALYAGGLFDSFGAQPASGLARWDGTDWSPVGGGTTDVFSLGVYDHGTGPWLYASGTVTVAPNVTISGVQRWNGSFWLPLPGLESGIARAMQVYDDGSGPALFLTGSFTVAGAPGTQRAVRWDGSIATAAGAGLPSGAVPSMAVYDSGTGPKLYAGVGSPGGGVLVWNGTSWTTTTPHLPARRILALATYTDANGTALYAAGEIEEIGGTTYHNVARFDGTTWSPVGGGVTPSGEVYSLVVHDDGGGSRLYAGGYFQHAGGLPTDGLASWDGVAWRQVPDGPNLTLVRSLASFDDGGGPGLYVGGSFARTGRVAAANTALWRNGEWERIATGQGPGGAVEALFGFDDGTGSALYAGGSFETAGTTVAKSVARWDGASWSALGAPVDTDGSVRALGAYDAGAGAQLVAGGYFTGIGGTDAARIATWNGTSWAPLGSGLVHTSGFETHAEAVAVFDSGSGPELIVGGRFTHAGGVAASNIARWNGTSWSPLGAGVGDRVTDLIVHDDGSGLALYACGWFATAGGIAAPRVARWDGSTWSAVGASAGFSQPRELAVLDVGFGPELFMCGVLTSGFPLDSVARWNGASWSFLGPPQSGVAEALVAFHDGVQARLYAAFRSIGGTIATVTIRAWDGDVWSTEGTLTANLPLPGAFAVHDAESDGVPDLWFGGSFEAVDGVPSANLALFRSCGTVGTVTCAGDGSGTSCPCGNSGASGRGCANSVVAAGARLSSVGIASLAADALTLEADGMTGTTALFFQGTSFAPVPFDDGLMCASGTLMRLRNATVVGGEARFPSSGDGLLSVSGMIQGPGEARTYQVRYRNAASFCTPGSTNFTNGLRVVWSH